MSVPALSTQCCGIHPHHSHTEKLIEEDSVALKELIENSVNVPIIFAYQISPGIYREVYACCSFPHMELCLMPRCHDGPPVDNLDFSRS